MNTYRKLHRFAADLHASWALNEGVEWQEAEDLVAMLNQITVDDRGELQAILEYAESEDEWDSDEVASWPERITTYLVSRNRSCSMHLINENAPFCNDPDELSAYKQVAEAWNRIHRRMAAEPGETMTTKILELSFFIGDGFCMAASPGANWTTLTAEDINDALVIEGISGQSAEDLLELADAMDAWVENPAFIRLPTGTPMMTETRRALNREFSDDLERYYRPA